MSAPEAPELDAWIGRERVEEDLLAPGPARSLAATLDRSGESLREGAPLPPGWHWIYFRSPAARSRLGSDGHEKLGELLPALPDSRRMWAGGNLRLSGSLLLGERVERRTIVEAITPKVGRSGSLIFVTLRHRISSSAGVMVDEEQELVYRLAGPSGPGAHAAEGGAGEGATGSAAGGAAARASTAADLPEPAWREPFVADEVTLFRFSALTFNGHRIHYDHPYATVVEGYPGLVVHGPLLALLLLDAGVRRLPGGGAALGGKLLSFRYRAVGPAFCNEPLRLEGLPDAGSLRAVHAERGVLMEAALTSTT